MGAVKSSTRTTLLTKISIFQNYFIVFFLSLVSPKYFEFGSAVSYFFKKIQYCLLLTRLLLKKKNVYVSSLFLRILQQLASYYPKRALKLRPRFKICKRLLLFLLLHSYYVYTVERSLYFEKEGFYL